MAHRQANEALRDARSRAGLTQVDLSTRSGVSQSVISSMEGGHLPGAIVSAVLIARTLNTTVEDLYGGLVAEAAPTDADRPTPTPPGGGTRKARTEKLPVKKRAAKVAKKREKAVPTKSLDRRVQTSAPATVPAQPATDGAPSPSKQLQAVA